MRYPKRKPNRLKGYDYASNGGYFITICTKNKQNLFWAAVGAAISRPEDAPALSPYGKITDQAIQAIPCHYPQIEVHKYCVMPNHVHLILLLQEENGGRLIAAPTVSRVIGQMKRVVSREIGVSIWQKSYHDRIIRDEAEYLKIWNYIDTNPLKWNEDCYYECSQAGG